MAAAAHAHLTCAFFFDAEPAVGEASFQARLDACALCAKPLARDSDIFMYRGDTPFCSEDCRDEQMQIDAIRARRASSARSGGRRQAYNSAGAAESRRGHRDARNVSAVATT